MRALMGLIKDRHGTYYARHKVPERLQAAVARDVTQASAQWALFQLRLCLRNDPVELDLHRFGPHVRLGDHFGAERFFQPHLSRFAVVQDTRQAAELSGKTVCFVLTRD